VPIDAATTDTLRRSMVDFLVDRLTEDLAALWDREAPGLANQIAVLDEMLTVLRSRTLPCRRELRLLLFGYGAHPDYESAWVHLVR